MNAANPYAVNKKSYLKPGSAVTKSHKEDEFFDHMFEVVLNQDYEDNVDYKRIEHEKKVLFEQ